MVGLQVASATRPKRMRVCFIDLSELIIIRFCEIAYIDLRVTKFRIILTGY